jgi:glycosyltransferase involved in cell wall biosynthesis
MKITACIITLDEERNLPRCLKSIASVADEILVVDSGSTDATTDLARQAGARVIRQDWLGYVGQKNFARDRAAYSWVLSIDADEELSPELAEAITKLKNDPAAEAPGAPNGYTVSRMVFYRGRWIRHGDWYPDRLVRLFRRNDGRFLGGRVHEKLEIVGKHPLLPGHLHHYTYENAAARKERATLYAELWAQTAYEQLESAYPWSAPVHALARLVKGFIFKGGFLDGAIGWDIAAGNTRETWLKYRKLRKMSGRL